jgi:PAS domain S-box-containing protein
VNTSGDRPIEDGDVVQAREVQRDDIPLGGIQQLDLETVIRVSEALSSEIDQERLIDTLMRLAMARARAGRGVLLLSPGDELRQVAEAIASRDGIIVRRPQGAPTPLPQTIVRYVLRTGEIVMLDDAPTHAVYSADPYVVERRARSVLCLPLAREARISGVLYLENNLVPHVFTPSRAAVLKLLALQAGIALENARLYSDLAQAKKALLESERNLQLIIDTMPALVWSARADGSVEFVNQHYSDYVGLPPEQLLGWGWLAAVHPDDVVRLETVWREAMAAGKGGEAEARFRRSDGEYRWLLARVNPLRDGAGNIVKWYGLSTDIEDRKRAEIHLTGEKQVLEMIASGRPLREILAALCRFFERSAPACYCGIYPIDWSGKKFQYGVAPSLPESYTAPTMGALVISDDSPRGQSISEKAQVISEDIESDVRWASAPCRAHVLEHGLRAVWSTPISSRNGSVVGTVCVYQRGTGSPSPHHQEMISHVTHLASVAIERSQAEAALRRSETFLTEGQRISLTGSFLWKVDTDELTLSEQLKRILEFDAYSEVTFEMIGERIHPDDLPMLAEKQAQMRSGRDNHEYEVRLRMPDGRVKYMRVFGRVIGHEDGRVEYLGAAQDVTRRRLAEEARDMVRSELAHVSRVVSLGALSASIAHEINQPLASIIMNGETGLRGLSQAEPNLEKIRDLMRRIVGDARRATEIVDGVRAMASRGSTTRTEIKFAEIITESTTFLQYEFQMRNVSVSFDLAPDLPMIVGDRTQLQQVVVNLAMNAMQAMMRSGVTEKSIAIRARKIDEATICCIVEDSGPGIGSEHLPHLFDRFFTTRETGMGLGLPIVQSIIEAHGGRIRVDNESTLGGARFVFDLPAASGDARESRFEPPAARASM